MSTTPANERSTNPTGEKTPPPPQESSTPVKETPLLLGMQKILFAVSEVAPFIATGGMAQVVSALPKALSAMNQGFDIRIVSPYYQRVRHQYGHAMEFIGHLQVPLAWRSLYCGVFRVVQDQVTYYFLDNEYYFNRENAYGYLDDGERFAFFSAAVLASLELMQFTPDIIHCHDWQSALVPIYLKTRYAAIYPQVKSVFTIHNIQYQGSFNINLHYDIFGVEDWNRHLVEFNGDINLMKGAIVCCDRLTTVSPSYAEEIKYGGGYGLEPIINIYHHKLSGILNGIDISLYDPETDPTLALNFSRDTLEHKVHNKKALQALFGLPVAPRTPVLCMVSRLVPHKGIDLLTTVVEDLLSDNIQLVILGTGDHHYELYFQDLARHRPDKVAVNIAFNPEISNKIIAGSDMMLMPSASEPCGLSQMIACRYATIPIARATGGLKDTITDCRGGVGNGFVFEQYDPVDLISTIRVAVDLYKHYEEDWKNLMGEAMRSDFSWDLSAKAYAELYAGLR